jgi:hypothetical protein
VPSEIRIVWHALHRSVYVITNGDFDQVPFGINCNIRSRYYASTHDIILYRPVESLCVMLSVWKAQVFTYESKGQLQWFRFSGVSSPSRQIRGHCLKQNTIFSYLTQFIPVPSFPQSVTNRVVMARRIIQGIMKFELLSSLFCQRKIYKFEVKFAKLTKETVDNINRYIIGTSQTKKMWKMFLSHMYFCIV